MAEKKVVKPTRKEKERIERRLKKLYPQMYETVAPPGTKTKLKQAQGADRRILLERMVAKKLKKIYGGK